MKTTLVLFSVLFAANAFASDRACEEKLQREAFAYNNFRSLLLQKGGLPSLRDCKEVHFNRDGQNIDNNVYLTEDGRALLIQNNTFRSSLGLKGNLSLTPIPGLVKEYKVVSGRLAILTADHRILIVTRTGQLFEMLASDGTSYRLVTGIKIDRDDLVLEIGTREVRLSDQEVTDRLNTPGGFRAISLF